MAHTTSKLPVAVVMGGYSPEWEISVKTGLNVANDLDTKLFDVYPILIRPEGWHAEVLGKKYPVNRGDFSLTIDNKHITFAGVFMAIHGTPGEDGKFQGYLDVLGIPYTSSGVFESALTFNKAECNLLLKQFWIPGAKAIYHTKGDHLNWDAVIAELGLPLFVKPSRSGSSFGVSKVKRAEELPQALEKAYAEDHRVLLESMLEGREVSCGVSNWTGEIAAIAVTEIVPEGEFFDFKAKYEGRSQEITPARLTDTAYTKVMELAEEVYERLYLNGLARCDFFVDAQENVYLVEVNSVPGLSDASIIPQQIRYRNWTTKEVFSRLLLNCIETHKAK